MNTIEKENLSAYYNRYGEHLDHDMLPEENISEYKKEFDELYLRSHVNADIGRPEVLKLCFCFGFADGIFIRKILDTLPDDMQMIIYEPDRLSFLYVIRSYDISDLIINKNVNIVYGDKDGLRSVIENNISILNGQYMGMLVTPGYEDKYPEALKDMQSMIAACKDTWVYHSGLECMNELYALSVLYKNHVFKDLCDAIPTRDIPIIIVAAGPSLEKNVDQLKSVGNKAIIVAVSHAAKTVIKHNIHPDFFAEIDSKMNNGLLDFEHGDQYIIMKPQAARDKQEKFAGKCFYYGFESDSFKAVKNIIGDGEYNSGGSVATDIFDLFAKHGFRNIILIGQDLAYDKEGYSHTGNYIDKEHTEYTDEETVDIYGSPIKTRSDWLVFIRAYERLIKLYPGIRVIDATEGGARIAGTEIKTLKDSISELCALEYPVDEWIRQVPVSGELYGRDFAGNEIKKFLDNTMAVVKEVDEALLWNSRVIAAMETANDTGWYLSVSAHYDELFKSIMEREDNALLCYYCGDEVKKYIQEYTRIQATGFRNDLLLADKDFLNSLSLKGKELIGYIKELIK